LVFSIDYATRPEIKLGKYKKFGMIFPELRITDDDINRELLMLQKKYIQYEKIDDGTVGPKQKLILETSDCIKGENFSKKKDIEFFTREDENLIDEHELRKLIQEKIWGRKINEEIEIEYSPSGKPDEESGKKETYIIRLKIKEINKIVMPELDDEFTKKVSSFDTFDKLKSDINKQLEIHGKALIRQNLSKKILDKIVEMSNFVIPQVLIDKEVQARVKNLSKRLNIGEKSLEELAQIMGKSAEDFSKELDEISVKQFKNHLILDKITEKEKILISDDDLEYEYKIISQQTNEKIEKIRKIYEKDDLKWEFETEIKNRKAIDFLIDKNTKSKKNEEVYYIDLISKKEENK